MGVIYYEGMSKRPKGKYIEVDGRLVVSYEDFDAESFTRFVLSTRQGIRADLEKTGYSPRGIDNLMGQTSPAETE